MEMSIFSIMETALNMEKTCDFDSIERDTMYYHPGEFLPCSILQSDYKAMRQAVRAIREFLNSYYDVNISDITVHIPEHEEDTFAERESDLINENKKDNEENGLN